MKLALAVLLGLFISYNMISGVLGNNYVWKVLLAIGQYLFPRRMPESNYSYSLQNKVSKWQLMKRLDKIDYFRPFSTEEKAAFLNCLKKSVYSERYCLFRLNNSLFEYDKRSFILEYFDKLIIDAVGTIHKWEGLVVRTAEVDLMPFYNYLVYLGLQVKFELIEETDSDGESYEVFDLYLNGAKFRFNGEYVTDAADFSDQLVTTVNHALAEIKAGERLYIWDGDPAILIFLSEEQYKYLCRLKR